MRNLLFIALLGAIFSLSSALAMKPVSPQSLMNCVEILASHPVTWDELFFMHRSIQANPKLIEPKNSALRRSFESGLPYLRTLAEENETTIEDFLTEYFTLAELVVDVEEEHLRVLGATTGDKDILAWAKKMADNKEVAKRDLRQTPQLIAALSTKGKLKNSAWDRMTKSYRQLQVLGVIVTQMEYESGEFPRPTFHPFGVVDSGYLEHLFSALDEIAFDQVARKEAGNLQMLDQLTAPRSPLLEETPESPNEERTEPNREIAQPVVASPTIANSNELSVRLKYKLGFSEREIYRAKTTFGLNLNISLTDDEFSGVLMAIIYDCFISETSKKAAPHISNRSQKISVYS